MKLIIGLMALTLAGCTANTFPVDTRRGNAPQTQSLIQASESVGAKSNSPTLIRIFKESHELELWRKTSSGAYALVRSYDICAFSGDLGPKNKQGDRQAPEGFYSIKPHQMNYNSVRFLSMNTGFPNEYDKFHKATGSALMIHGGCDSAGCYAIQDGPMQEVFAAVRDSLKAGQKSVQLQIYPFRMSKWAMMTHTSKHEDFWHQLKFGYDKFESTRRELDVIVVKGRYQVK